MTIDWITVAAQLVNFLVLVWLLKRFLYRPILTGIDARETEIAERMAIAERTRKEAKATQQAYQDKVASLQAEHDKVAETIRHEAEKERDALLSEARSRNERERAAWAKHLENEAQEFSGKLRRTAGHALLELTRKALTDLADETLEARIAARLAQKFHDLDGDLKEAAGQTIKAVVTSQNALSPAVRDRIRDELQKRYPDIDIAFETNASQSPGLVLRLGGAQLEWTIDTYIDGLEALLPVQTSPTSELRE